MSSGGREPGSESLTSETDLDRQTDKVYNSVMLSSDNLGKEWAVTGDDPVFHGLC